MILSFTVALFGMKWSTEYMLFTKQGLVETAEDSISFKLSLMLCTYCLLNGEQFAFTRSSYLWLLTVHSTINASQSPIHRHI